MGRIRVAVSGDDITTTDPKDLAFDSDQACMVIVSERIDTLTETASDHIETLAHGLGYRPTFRSYEEVSAGVWSKSLVVLNIWADTTNINYHLYAGSDAHRIKTVIVANSQNGAVGSSLSNADGRVQVAKSGYDLNSITDLRQVAFSSKKGVMLVSEKVTINVVGDGVSTDTTFTATHAHGLGYIPQFEAILSDLGLPVPYFEASGGDGASFDVTVDDTNITCSVSVFGAAVIETVPFRVHILCGKIE